MPATLSVCIVNWNTVDDLHVCLSALAQFPHTLGPTEIIVVDNGSDDGSAAMVRRAFPQVVLIANPENELYAHATNQAVARATGAAYLLLNPDVRVTPGALDTLMAELLHRPRVGAMGSRLLNPDGTTQRSVRGMPHPRTILWDILKLSRLPRPRPKQGEDAGEPAAFNALRLPNTTSIFAYRLPYFDYDREQWAPQPMASCFLIRAEAWAEVGGMDEAFPLYFNDADYCLRLWHKNWVVCYTPKAAVWHGSGNEREGGGTTRRTEAIRRVAVWESHRALLRFWRKHYPRASWSLYTLLTALVTLGAWARTGRWGESLGKWGGDTTPADLRRQLEREG